MIEGRLTEDNYTNKEGVEVKRYEILADDIAMSLRFANTDSVERTQAAPAPAEEPF
jgi:single-stranded DNA-binding protein